ncbi:hypothetical protein GBAR_LOCUS24108, partial [Geodia barretti]
MASYPGFPPSDTNKKAYYPRMELWESGKNIT